MSSHVKNFRKKLLLGFVLFAFIIFVAVILWVRHPQNEAKKVQVSASFYPIATFARQVGGDKVEVHTLISPGVEPHDYEPKPQDLKKLYRSKAFIYNGAGLEPWVERLQPDMKAQGIVTVNATSGIPLLAADKKAGAYDPHVWLDPVLAQVQVRNIAQGLSYADPNNAAYYRHQAEQLTAKLAALDQTFHDGLLHCQSRQIVTSHNAFAYLAKRYNLQIQTLAGLSPEDEPSPQELAKVASFVKAHHVSYIFTEELASPKLAQTLAQETGAQTLPFNPLEGLTSQEEAQGKTYFSVQKENLHNLQRALHCK